MTDHRDAADELERLARKGYLDSALNRDESLRTEAGDMLFEAMELRRRVRTVDPGRPDDDPGSTVLTRGLSVPGGETARPWRILSICLGQIAPSR